MNIEGTTRASCANTADPGNPATTSRGTAFRAVFEASRAVPAEASTAVTLPGALAGSDAEAFSVFVEANRRAESGGAASFSTLATTAGRAHRASFGVGQLTVREHLSQLASLDDRTLAELASSRAEIETMRARGDAALAFYRLIVDGSSDEVPPALSVSRGVAERAADLSARGDTAALVELVGARFTASTGLPESALGELLATRVLLRQPLRDAFRAQYAHDHGVPFDPAHRDRDRMATSASHVLLAHPELERAADALGRDTSGTLALAHYLGVGDVAENRLGWHARAAREAVGDERFVSLLARADARTSGARESLDFSRALAAVSGVPDLTGEARVVLLARIGRAFHGAPARARARLFVDGALDAPRFHSRAALEGALDHLRERRTWSDERLLGHLEAVLEARRSA